MARLPVILLASPNERDLEEEAKFYRDLGHTVELCVGPQARGGCPLLTGDPCPLVENADGVIFQLDLDVPENRRVLAKYIKYFDHLQIPVRAVVTPQQKERWAHLLELVEVWTTPVTVGKLDGFSAEVESGWEQAPKPHPASAS